MKCLTKSARGTKSQKQKSSYEKEQFFVDPPKFAFVYMFR